MLNPLTDPVTIERLREVLAAVGLPVNARELTEILWLACQLTAEPATADGAPADGHPSDQQPGQSGMQEGPAEGASPSLTDVGAARTSVTSDAFASQGLYAEARTDGRSFDTRTVRVPTAPMLHNTLTIQRALRPLKRKVASRRADTLDEDATARRIAEQPPRERRWVPACRHHRNAGSISRLSSIPGRPCGSGGLSRGNCRKPSPGWAPSVTFASGT